MRNGGGRHRTTPLWSALRERHFYTKTAESPAGKRLQLEQPLRLALFMMSEPLCDAVAFVLPYREAGRKKLQYSLCYIIECR